MRTDYEVKVLLRKMLGYDDVVIFEIGANKGKDTLEFVDVFPACEIYAFEPDPSNFEYLNDALWSCLLPQELKNVHPFPIAVSNKNGFAEFTPSKNSGLSGSLKTPKEHLSVYPDVEFGDKIEVSTTTLDRFVEMAGIKEIDIVHMDVQGAELEVFEGGKNTFANKVKYIFTEFSKTELYEGAPTLEQILEALPEFELEEISWQWEHDGNALLKRKGL